LGRTFGFSHHWNWLRLFSPSEISAAAKEPRSDEPGGHDSAAARAIRPPPCRFIESNLTAGCALPRYLFAAESRVKEEEIEY
jgi:hypothetical protein